MRHFISIIIHDGSIDSEEREGRGTWLAGGCTRQWGDHVCSGLCLPPGIDNRATLRTDVLVEPHPSLGINRLSDSAKQAK